MQGNSFSEDDKLQAWREAFAPLNNTEDGMEDTVTTPLPNNEIGERRSTRERR